MNANKIRTEIADKAQAAGLDPSGPLGYADLLGFGKRYNSRGRVGLLGVPDDVVSDKEAFFGNPTAQIDAGIELMRKAKEQGGDDFSALLSYTGDPSATVRSMIRGTKYSGQPLSAGMIQQAAQMAGVEMDPIEEAKKAGVILQPDAPPQVDAPEMANVQPEQGMDGPGRAIMQEQAEQPLVMAQESTSEQRKERVRQAFGSKDTTTGLSSELNTYLRKML